MIPRRIILTQNSRYQLKPLEADCFAKLKELMPDWEILFFDHGERDAFVRDQAADFQALYHFYPRVVQQCDVFRALALRNLGGFYLDMDVHLNAPLDSLLAFDAVFCLEWKMTPLSFRHRRGREPLRARELWQFANYGMATAPGHWIWDEVLAEMEVRAHRWIGIPVANEDVYGLTGPDLLSDIIHANRGRLSQKTKFLRGRLRPEGPRPEYEGSPHWFQFGEFGSHLMAGAWK